MKKSDKDEELKQQYRQSVKWFFKYRLRNGVEGCYPISSVAEKDRLWDALQLICEEEKLGFFEFDSDTHRIVIQASQLAFFQFLFVPPISDLKENTEGGKAEDNKSENDDEDNDDEHEEGWDSLKVYFVESQNPVVLNVDFDQPDHPDDDGDYGEVGNFLWEVLHVHDGWQLVSLTDEDGETAFFRGTSIALVEAPLKVLLEKFLDPSGEDSDE